ncbi:hypothetical protein CDAR_35471 [Caerostris darwini]|uniref:Uncharacterized protein n=1 Tax=Caerostris darwini TaxID=1538125 RepID=A0AAV4SM46_9ARAC|nr:hypothetical protein CDAR_35471 [Caerostris darwini]
MEFQAGRREGPNAPVIHRALPIRPESACPNALLGWKGTAACEKWRIAGCHLFILMATSSGLRLKGPQRVHIREYGCRRNVSKVSAVGSNRYAVYISFSPTSSVDLPTYYAANG